MAGSGRDTGFQRNGPVASEVRRAELIAALSLAIDLGLGQPMEHVLHACRLAVRLGDHLGLDEPALAEGYYLTLLSDCGCVADSHVGADTVGDEVSSNSWIVPAFYGNQTEFLGAVVRHLGN